MAYRSFLRREHQSFLRKIHGTACYFLPIHNVTINSNNLFVNFRWTFVFCVEKSYDRTHLPFGGTWIVAAISNTPHSNKAGSITLKRTRLTGKE
jgi:hypothetical protein